MRRSPSLSRLACAACACFALARALSGFLEAMAHEREERAGDDDLAELCANGYASSSPRMRQTCLQMRRARATPIVIKAALRAVSSAYTEFAAHMFNWPTLLSLAAFVLVGVASPLSKIAWALLPTRPTHLEEDEEQNSCRLVVLGNGDLHPAGRALWKRMLGRKALEQHDKFD